MMTELKYAANDGTVSVLMHMPRGQGAQRHPHLIDDQVERKECSEAVANTSMHFPMPPKRRRICRGIHVVIGLI